MGLMHVHGNVAVDTSSNGGFDFRLELPGSHPNLVYGVVTSGVDNGSGDFPTTVAEAQGSPVLTSDSWTGIRYVQFYGKSNVLSDTITVKVHLLVATDDSPSDGITNYSGDVLQP